MSHLLDINVLVALFDPRHVNHDVAHRWFGTRFSSDWATCSMTEAGCIRVLSNPAYPTARPVLRLRRTLLWLDDLSLRATLDDELRGRLLGHQQLTDLHLAALASRWDGRLVTFDRRLGRSVQRTRLETEVLLVQ